VKGKCFKQIDVENINFFIKMTSRIDKFRGIHQGRSIAVLGSSPTIGLYRGREDVSIAVNGSILCDAVTKVDYYMCGDKNSPHRKLFNPSFDVADRRIVTTFIAPYDHLVIPDEAKRKNLQEILERDELHKKEAGGNIRFSPPDMIAQNPHGIFDYADIWEEEICPNQNRLCRGATISGVAAQMAMVMGAKEIHLYGCSFGDIGGVHYGYDPLNDPGGITNSHPITMDYLLSRIRLSGVEIVSHGETRLRVPRKVDIGS